MRLKQVEMEEKATLYNSRIIKVFLDYLGEYYPEIDVDPLLEYTGATRYEIEDPGHWLTQEKVDRFYEILVEKTGNPDIAREAGRHAASTKELGPIKQYTLGLLSAISAYLLIGRLYPKMSRGADVTARRLGPNSVEIISTPKIGVDEKPYQCENRIGMFESMAAYFTSRYAKVEHPTCLHKGGEFCRYVISWERVPSLLWKRLRNISVMVGTLVSLVLFFLLPFFPWVLVATICAVISAALWARTESLRNRDLARTIETQGDAAKEHLEEINIRYNNALLVQEIGEATSTILDIERLVHTVVRVMNRRLGFDRGLIMLANQDRTRLIYSAGYGYTKAQEDLLQGTEFHLDNPESRGMFVRAYREQKPFLINDINEVEKTLSHRSLELARRMGVRSLLSVPVVYEKASLGVVAVDNVDSKRSFTQSDVSLLMGVASQTAVSITNAISFQKLRESEKKYRELVENANSIILRRDPRGKVTFFNEFAQAFFGYSEEEIVGKNVVGTIVPEKESTGRDLATMVRDIGRDPEKYANNENENVRHNGDRVWVAWTNKAIRDRYGQIVEILCVGNDITARKQAEEALRESEEKYRNILESMEEGYFEADLAGNLTFFNDALCRMSGYPPEELIGMNNREYMNEENAKRIYRVFNKVYETGKPARVREYEIMSKDGRPRTFEMSTSLIRDDAGNPLGFRGVVRDVSKRLEAEKEKAKLEAHLQRARKMEAIGALAGGVAHDLNNILTALVSYPELLLIKLPEESPMKRPLQTIKKSGEKAAAIVQDLLTLARRGVAVTEVTDLNAIISEYLTSPEYKKLISFHPEVRLKVKLDPSLLNILGSPVHLSKTVMNLVSNGAEAMPEGGVIHITTENRYVDALIKGYDEIKQGDYATLSVSDTGIGISPDDMERIFEPFYTKKVMGRSGTGLGMAVVWGTVRDHKGYIDVESRQGKGSRFTLYFPVIRQAVEREEDRLAVENYRGKGESVLVVDDVEEQREIATGMLEELGYSVTAVPSGEEAVAYLKAHSVDLVLLDMIMDPGMDGLETYRRICRDHPGQRAVIVSGYSESDRVKEAQLLGAGPYVKKPYLLEAIGGAVRAELDK